MADDVAISVQSVSKDFMLPHEKQSSVKGAFVSLFRGQSFEKQEALKDITFEVKKGEFFGIVGRNGSGKSTLLKLLAGIYYPTKGDVHVSGSLTPFIELGVGFNPELTGRENVFLNGALLGFDRTEMSKMYKDIVEFAELQKFMDQKLKNYSSGMQVRLAFSIAIRARADILVLDEVLAVGDAAFQKKCNAIFHEYKNSDRTVILVTHDMQAVKKFCDRVAVINNSKLIGIYTPSEAAAVYQEINASEKSADIDGEQHDVRRWGDGKVKVKSVEVLSDGKKAARNQIAAGADLELKIKLESKTKSPVTVGVMFEDSDGVNIAGPNSTGVKLSSQDTVTLKVKKVPFLEGDYRITVAVFSEDLSEEHDHIYNGYDLKVINKTDRPNFPGKIDLYGEWEKDKGAAK